MKSKIKELQPSGTEKKYMKQGTHKHANKSGKWTPYSRCGTLEQLDVNFPSSTYKRSLIRLGWYGNTGTLIHPGCVWGETSFKRNLVKVKKKCLPSNFTSRNLSSDAFTHTWNNLCTSMYHIIVIGKDWKQMFIKRGLVK